MTMQNMVFRSEMTMKKKDCHISSFLISVHKRMSQTLLKALRHTSGTRNHYLYFTDEKAKAQKTWDACTVAQSK